MQYCLSICKFCLLFTKGIQSFDRYLHELQVTYLGRLSHKTHSIVSHQQLRYQS